MRFGTLLTALMGGRHKPDRVQLSEDDILRSYPRLEPGQAVVAIGDIHGRADLLADLIAKIDDRRQRGLQLAHEIYLGDYVDRGPDSSHVIEMLLRRRERYPEIVLLSGNHEEMMLRALEHDDGFEDWLGYGGRATLASYDVKAGMQSSNVSSSRQAAVEAIPEPHKALLQDLQTRFQVGPYFFAHAGIRPGIRLDQQSARDLRNIREPFLSSPHDHGAIVVHGHSPVSNPEFRPNRINLDTGAFHSNRLTCLLLSDEPPELLT